MGGKLQPATLLCCVANNPQLFVLQVNCLLGGLLLVGNGLDLALPGAGVGLGPLAAHGQTLQDWVNETFTAYPALRMRHGTAG